MKVFTSLFAIVTSAVLCNAGELHSGIASGFGTLNGNIGWKSGDGSISGGSNGWNSLRSGFGVSGGYGSSNQAGTKIWQSVKSGIGSAGSSFGNNNAWKSSGAEHEAKSYIKIIKTIGPSTTVIVPEGGHKASPLNNEWKSVGSGIGRYGDSSSWQSGATHGIRLGSTGSKATSYVNIVSYNKAAAPDTSNDGWSGVNYGGRSYGSSNDWKSDEGSSSGWW